MKSNLAVLGGTVVTPDRSIEDGIVLAADGRITYVGPAHEPEPLPNSTIIEAQGKLVLPGLIDTHVHGSHGDDVMLGGAEGIRRVSRALLRYGTTSYLPSTVSARHDELLSAIEACVEAERYPALAVEIYGL